MGRTTIIYISVVFLLLQRPVKAGFWTVDIDLSPAPSPQDGPPFSAHASRNRALLPAQICGVVGAYVGFVLLTGSLLLTVGRRLRRRAQTVPANSAMEMVKPAMSFGGSPTSPRSPHSWYSPRRLKPKSSIPGSLRSGRSATNLGSPGIESNYSFDPNVLEADRATRQQQLEALYAAALAQEDIKSHPTTTHELELPPQKGISTSLRNSRRPPKLMTSALHLQSPTNPVSPISTKSPVRAIYPPTSPLGRYPSSPASQYPTSPLSQRYPTSSDQPNPPIRPSSSRSQGNHKRFRKTLRHLHISNPMPTSPSDSSDARTPLSPRYYIDPGVPPSPPARSEAPTTPATYRSSIDGIENMDQIRDLPQAAPQRAPVFHHPNTLAPISTNTTTTEAGSTSSLGALPFRTMTGHQQTQYPHYQNQANRHLQPPLSSSLPLPSPQMNTKITYLERRRDLFSNCPPPTGAATPYTPYMPFTPITPVTPRLASRAERKQRLKERARTAPVMEEDGVLEEDEMWGGGY